MIDTTDFEACILSEEMDVHLIEERINRAALLQEFSNK